MGFWGTKGQVTPKSIVQPGWNLNLSEILCLSRLSASFIVSIKTKRQSNMRFFGSKGQVTPKSVVRSGRNSNLSVSVILCLFRFCKSHKGIGLKLAHSPVVTCKFEDDLIKSEGSILRTIFSPL